MIRCPEIGGHRHHQQYTHDGSQRPLPLPNQQQDRWKENVELLLYRQRPEVKQWLEISRGVEVSALLPEYKVLDEERPRRHMLAELFKFIRKQDQPSIGHGDHQHGDQRRKESPDTPCVELPKAKWADFSIPSVCFKPLVQNPTDQVTADHKEDIDSDKPSGNHPRKGMVDHHS
jgi:hypothetical protein